MEKFDFELGIFPVYIYIYIYIYMPCGCTRYIIVYCAFNSVMLLTGPCADAHLDEAQRQERHVISAEERVEEHFFDAAVEVGFELLHLAADELGRRRAAVCGHVLKTGEMITQVLSQQRQEVFGSRLRPVGVVLLGETAVGGSGLSATLLMEAAERHVNTEPESDTQRDRRLNPAHITERHLRAAKTVISSTQ